MFAETENWYAEQRDLNTVASGLLLALLHEHHPERSPADTTKIACKALATPEPAEAESVPEEPPFQLRPRFRANPIRTIAQSASTHFHTPLAELLSDGRSAESVRARHVVMYLARMMTTRSLPWIGVQMGGRDHSTIWHGINKVRSLLPTDQALCKDVVFAPLLRQARTHQTMRDG